jgi:hypothetical protein
MNQTAGNPAVVRCRSLMFIEKPHGPPARLVSGFAGIGFIGQKALTI